MYKVSWTIFDAEARMGANFIDKADKGDVKTSTPERKTDIVENHTEVTAPDRRPPGSTGVPRLLHLPALLHFSLTGLCLLFFNNFI